MNVIPGQYFVLNCGVENLPNASYYWLKNGENMPGENRPQLIFNPFRPEHEGYYSCRVVGPDDDILTKLMYLKVGKYMIASALTCLSQGYVPRQGD